MGEELQSEIGEYLHICQFLVRYISFSLQFITLYVYIIHSR